MKKIILLSTAVLAWTGCSSDTEDVESNTLSPVNIEVETYQADNSTRAIWGPITADEDGNMTITVKFEGANETAGSEADKFDMYEYGFEGHQVFTYSDPTSYQSGNFSGEWHKKDGTYWAAVLPSGAASSVNIQPTGSSPYNDYYLSVPTTQTTRSKVTTVSIPTTTTTYIVSPDKSANIMIGAKSTHETATCFLAPVCSYLYFLTSQDISTVTVSSSTAPAGSFFVRTGCNWDGWLNYSSLQKTITRTSSGVNSITANGALLNRNNAGAYNEYVVCIIPGSYNDLYIKATVNGEEKILAKATNKDLLKFEAVNLYYLGIVGE